VAVLSITAPAPAAGVSSALLEVAAAGI
jgi:hypothetical protein